MTNNRVLIGERIEYAIGRYIKGEVEKINIVILKAIADYLDVNPVWLMGKDVQMEIAVNNRAKTTNTLLYEGKDELKVEIAMLTKQILDNTENTDTLVMLRDMLSGVCKK